MLSDSACQPGPHGIWTSRHTSNIVDDGVLVDADAEHLTLAVHTDNTAQQLVLGGSEDGLARNSVHVDARARLEVVQVDEAKLGDEVDDAVLLRHLHRDGKVVCRLGREEDIDGLLLERRVGRLVPDLHDVQLRV